MANAVFLPGVNAAVNGIFGPWAALVNGGIALANVAPWLGELTHLVGSASEPIKALHKALEALYKASLANNFEAFQEAAYDVEQKIGELVSAPSKDNFKNYSRFQTWETYLKPLVDLKSELEHFRTRGLDGYDSSRLEHPLTNAVKFMNGEIKAHTGAINKALKTVVSEAKKVARQEFSGILEGAQRDIIAKPELSPLQTITHDLMKFRYNREGYLPEYVSETLRGDLHSLERAHPEFKGVHDYVLREVQREGETLVTSLDTHLVTYIRANIVPKLDGPLLHKAYYDAALQLKHVAKGCITDSKEEQIAWGRDRLQESITTPKAKGTLFAAVSYSLEIRHFRELEKLALTPLSSVEDISAKVQQVIALLQKHPTISMHPEFKQVMKGLIKGYIDTTRRKLGNGFIEKLQAVHRANSQEDVGGALMILKEILSGAPQREGRGTLLQDGIDAVRAQAKRLGAPAAVMDQVSHLADIVGSQVDSLMGSSSESQDSSSKTPLIKFHEDLARFRGQGEKYNQRNVQIVLDDDLRGIEVAYPLLSGLTKYVRDQAQARSESLVTRADRYINEFIHRKLRPGGRGQTLHQIALRHESSFHQALYHAAEANHMLGESDHRVDRADQIAWGKQFMSKTPSEQSPIVLWKAIGFIMELDGLESVVSHLQHTSVDSEEEISRSLDIALVYLEANPHIQGSRELSHQITAMVIPLINATIDSGQRLRSRAAQAEIRAKTNEATALSTTDPVAALRILKDLFDRGPLTSKVGVVRGNESPVSAVAALAEEFARGKTNIVGDIQERNDSAAIETERRILVQNLAYFGSFKVISQYCGIPSEQGDKIFEDILKEIDLTVDENPKEEKRRRETYFKERLEDLIDQSSNLGFFAKQTGKFLIWFSFKMVKHFASEFSKTISDHIHALMVNPFNTPLQNSLGMIEGANNGILALLFAERVWREDTSGTLGVNGKEKKLIEILEQEELNGGLKQASLLRRVVRKALDEFIPIGGAVKALEGWIASLEEKDNNLKGHPIKQVITAIFLNLGIVGLSALKLVFALFDSALSYTLKKGASYYINKLDLVNTVLKSMGDSIYSDKHTNYHVDAILLHQLKEFEKILHEDGGEMTIQQGENGKRLFKEFVENLFKLLDERALLSPEKLRERDNIAGQIKEALDSGTDAIIKSTVQQLLMFAFDTMQTKEQMNGTFLGALQQANRALQPNTENRLHEFYKGDPRYSEDDSLDALITRFKEDYPTIYGHGDGVVTSADIDAALQKKYGATEAELHEVLGRILGKTIDHVVTSQVGTLFKTSREVVLGHIKWLENQFDPYQSYVQTGAPSYIEEMKGVLRRGIQRNANIQEKLKGRHERLLIELKKHLDELKGAETDEASKMNIQIHRLYRATDKLVKELEMITTELKKGDYKKAYEKLRTLQSEMKKLKPDLTAVKHTLSDQSFGESVADGATAIARTGAQLAAPAIGGYVVGRLSGRAKEAILMYKSRAVFHAMVQHAVFHSYLRQERQYTQHSTVVAENTAGTERDFVHIRD